MRFNNSIVPSNGLLTLELQPEHCPASPASYTSSRAVLHNLHSVLIRQLPQQLVPLGSKRQTITCRQDLLTNPARHQLSFDLRSVTRAVAHLLPTPRCACGVRFLYIRMPCTNGFRKYTQSPVQPVGTVCRRHWSRCHSLPDSSVRLKTTLFELVHALAPSL